MPGPANCDPSCRTAHRLKPRDPDSEPDVLRPADRKTRHRGAAILTWSARCAALWIMEDSCVREDITCGDTKILESIQVEGMLFSFAGMETASDAVGIE